MKEEVRIIRAEYYIIREGRCSDKMLAATCVDISSQEDSSINIVFDCKE